MDYTIRPAVVKDAATIASFTQDTFDWGDYVADAFPHWLEDPQGRLLVAADSSDRAVAVSLGVMLSKTEAWLQGARVSEPWRRRGIASALGEAIVAWAVEHGGQVARLLTEAWNEPAQRQVEKVGFRHSSDWVVGARLVAGSEPATSHNGGQRAKARRKLELAHSSEAIPAWASWRSGPLIRPARGLFVDGWRWSRLTAERLERAGKQGRLWTSQAGWVVTRRDGDVLYADWLECGEESIDDMVKSIIDLAIESDAELLRITVPQIDWLVEVLGQNGFENSVMYLYERPL